MTAVRRAFAFAHQQERRNLSTYSKTPAVKYALNALSSKFGSHWSTGLCTSLAIPPSPGVSLSFLHTIAPPSSFKVKSRRTPTLIDNVNSDGVDRRITCMITSVFSISMGQGDR